MSPLATCWYSAMLAAVRSFPLKSDGQRLLAEPVAIALDLPVGLQDLPLGRLDGLLVPLHPDDVDGVLLVDAVDLELLSHELLGDLCRLCLQVRDLGGPDGTRH
jgi:hypothetical protein